MSTGGSVLHAVVSRRISKVPVDCEQGPLMVRFQQMSASNHCLLSHILVARIVK